MFVCECGKEFNDIDYQKFNSHKRFCKVHLFIKYGTETPFEAIEAKNTKILINAAAERAECLRKDKISKQLTEINDWQSNPRVCECCGKQMFHKFGSGRFCSRACANSHLRKNKVDGFHTPVPNKKPAKSFQKYGSVEAFKVARQSAAFENFIIKAPKCKICGTLLSYENRYKKTCGSKTCLRLAAIEAGKASATKTNRRSKNEIYFYELCKLYFKEVLHNEPMFGGWDADIIIPDIKYAILWNGPWHYKQIKRACSLEQIQNRDKIKIQEILNAGYTPYIIKDMGRYNKEFVQQKFIDFLESLKNKNS